MTLRTGITTGACAAAAAKAAAILLCGDASITHVDIPLPDGERITVPVLYARREGERATAAVRKDAGDDPDVTHGLEVQATVWFAQGPGVAILGGEGVGTVTKPGLQVPPGEPAINPVPRRMIRQALAEVTDRPLCVEIAIPGGRQIAAKTFNPRLGVVGGLSILGTTGIVRPFSNQAIRDTIRCSLDVAAACGVTAAVLAPGNIGARAARRHFNLAEQQVVEVSNEWGFALEALGGRSFTALLVVGHPGKLAKLADGEWDTHSSRSPAAVQAVSRLAAEILPAPPPACDTVEGIFAALAPGEAKTLGDALAARVRAAIAEKLNTEAKSDREIPTHPTPGDGESKTATGGLPFGDVEAAGSRRPAKSAESQRPPETLSFHRTKDANESHDHAGQAAEIQTGETPVPRNTPASLAVVLINMAGEVLGSDGDLTPWQ